jgi:hypothetical protein
LGPIRYLYTVFCTSDAQSRVAGLA